MKFGKNKDINQQEQLQPIDNGIIKETSKGYDAGPNSIIGPIKNYDDDFLKAHATKSDDLIFEELLFYINYKKQRGDFISYDEKVQIDRYCNLLLKQLKVNRLWREEKGINNIGGFNNIPQEFYDMVENKQLPIVNLYYKDPAISSFVEVPIRIPEDKLEQFKSLKYENPDKDFKGKSNNGANVLFTIDVSSHQQPEQVDKYEGLSKKEIKKLKKQEAKEAKKAKGVSTQQKSTNAAPNIPGRPNIPGQSSATPNIPGKPSIPGQKVAPSVPGAPNIPGKPVVPQQKPKGMFDL